MPHFAEIQPNVKPRTNGFQGGFILFRRRRVLPEILQEALPEAETITGINQNELKFRLTGIGVGALVINRPLEALMECAAGLEDLGLKTAVAEKAVIRASCLPVAARGIRVSDDALAFLDRDGETLFEINDRMALLLIVTDISGQTIRQRMTAMSFVKNIAPPDFAESVKKFAIAKPVAVFYDLNDPRERGVYVDTAEFSFMGLDTHRTCARGTNFQVMIRRAMTLARTCVTDDNFGLALLPGASPDWNLGKSAVEQDLGRYGGYLLIAARNQVIPGEKEENEAAAGLSQGKEPELSDRETEGPSETLVPPPDMRNSRIVSFFQSSMPEIMAVGILLTTPFSLFVSGVHAISAHQRLTTFIVGGGLFLAGLFLFGYALMLLHYRRMVENTPTSKIRSLSLGMVELSGKTRRYHDLRTPTAQTPCVFYNSRRYKLKKTSEGSHWTLIRSVSSGKIPFYIEDETGRVLINPRGAVFKIPMASQTFSGHYVTGLSLQLYDPDTRVTEDIIPVGGRIYVFGAAHLVRHGKDARTRIIEKLRLLKRNPEALAEYDANGDGRLDATEWESARNDMASQVYAETLTGEGEAGGESVVVEKPKLGMAPFIIADSEDRLKRHLLIRTILFLAAGWVVAMFGVRLLV